MNTKRLVNEDTCASCIITRIILYYVLFLSQARQTCTVVYMKIGFYPGSHSTKKFTGTVPMVSYSESRVVLYIFEDILPSPDRNGVYTRFDM